MSAESRTQTRAIKYAKTLGFLARRVYNGPGAETGWPDVEFFGPGARVVFMEFKAPGKEPSKIQVHRITALRALGFEAYIVDDFRDAKAVFDMEMK